jgi:hypothetical protein
MFQRPTLWFTAALFTLTSASHAAYSTGSIYDENTNQPNAVDLWGVASAGSELQVIEASEYAAYTATVAAAHAAGTGGVVHFDENVFEITSGTAFDASFDVGGADKSLAITPTVSGLVISGNGLAGYTPISQASTSVGSAGAPGSPPGGFLHGGAGSTTATFDIGAISNGVAGEYVNSFAFTLLSRDARDWGDVTVTATFGNASTATAVADVTPGAGLGDTFYGFVDTTGTGIASVTLTTSDNDGRVGFDDIAFTTLVPEPSSMLLIGMGGLALIPRRRG